MADVILDFFREYLPNHENYTFLCGAGISVSSPSNLPTGGELVKSIFKDLCLEDCYDDLLAHFENRGKQVNEQALRFEAVLQAVQEVLDPELHVLDYLISATKPNSIHRFLANCITKGHYVFTTNFDQLIELCDSKIISISTDEDFLNHKSVTFPIFKLHGGFVNRAGEAARSSIIASLGKILYKGEAKLSPQKHSVLQSLTRNRILIVLGYSGSDDYDIMPALSQLEDIKGLIWINHQESKNLVIESIFPKDNQEVGFSPNVPWDISNSIKQLSKLNPIYADRIVFVTMNTSRFIQEFDGRLFNDPSFLPVPSFHGDKILEIDSHKIFTENGKELPEDKFVNWKKMKKSRLSARLFAFVKDWLNADLCIEKAMEASYGVGDIAEFTDILEEIGVIQVNTMRDERALHVLRQAFLINHILLDDVSADSRILTYMKVPLKRLEQTGKLSNIFSPIENEKGEKTPFSLVAEFFAMKKTIEALDTESYFMHLLLHIDSVLKGPAEPEDIDVKVLKEKANAAVRIARELNDPKYLLEALTRQFVVSTLLEPEKETDRDVFEEVFQLRRILKYNQ